MIDENNAIQQLQSGMLNKALFVMSRVFPRPEDLPKHIPEHLEWMISMEKDGCIFAAGPFVDRHGKLAGGSMIIFRANSYAHARSIGEEDPLVQKGLVAYELREWRLMEGRMSFTVDFSDQDVRFD